MRHRIYVLLYHSPSVSFLWHFVACVLFCLRRYSGDSFNRRFSVLYVSVSFPPCPLSPSSRSLAIIPPPMQLHRCERESWALISDAQGTCNDTDPPPPPQKAAHYLSPLCHKGTQQHAYARYVDACHNLLATSSRISLSTLTPSLMPSLFSSTATALFDGVCVCICGGRHSPLTPSSHHPTTASSRGQ